MAVLHYYFTVGCMYMPWLCSVQRTAVYMNVTLEDTGKNTLLSITTPIQGDS